MKLQQSKSVQSLINSYIYSNNRNNLLIIFIVKQSGLNNDFMMQVRIVNI